MANYTINNLPNTVTELNGADTLPVWDSANNKTAKISGSNLSNSILSNLVTISASSTIVSGLPIKNGSCIKIMFTSAITGSDTTTAMTITYNGISIPVKVGKHGSLSNFVASEINSAYYYLQAYTTLELIYDGTQFIIVGNPVVLSSDSYTIYADGNNGKVRPRSISRQFLYDDTPLTSSGITFTASTDGLIVVHANKSGFGNTLILEVNYAIVDQIPYYTLGEDSGQMELVGFVRKGDTVYVHSDGSYDEFKIQCIILQPIEWG